MSAGADLRAALIECGAIVPEAARDRGTTLVLGRKVRAPVDGARVLLLDDAGRHEAARTIAGAGRRA